MVTGVFTAAAGGFFNGVVTVVDGAAFLGELGLAVGVGFSAGFH